MRFALIYGAVALLTLCGRSVAQEQRSQGAPYQAISDKFFGILQADKSAEAVDYVFGTNPLMAKMTDKIDQMKAQFTTLRTMSGRYITHVLLVESKVEGIYVYQHYLVAYERQPISVRLTYYKPGATWVCQSLQFDPNVDDVIRNVADSKIRVDTK